MAKGKIVVALVILSTILALILFVPYKSGGNNPDKFKDSEYYEIIRGIDNMLVENDGKAPKNNFETIVEMVKRMFGKGDEGSTAKHYLYLKYEEQNDTNYVELSEDRTPGVDAPSSTVTTSDYIFSIESRTVSSYNYNRVVRVYSAAGESSVMLCEYEMPNVNDGDKLFPKGLFISEDGKTLTVVGEYYIRNYGYTAIVALDVTNPRSITEKGRLLVDGELRIAGMSGDKIILVSQCGFSPSKIDYSRPSTFIPMIDTGNGYECMKMEDIYYYEGSYSYCVLSILDASSFEITNMKALMGCGLSNFYITEDNIYAIKPYVTEETTANTAHNTAMTDVNVINYSSGKLSIDTTFTVRGRFRDTYSIDERDGYLRLVTTTLEGYSVTDGETSSYRDSTNISLYVFNLEDKSLVYKNEDFAVEGESAFKVRFKGDNLYICTEPKTSFDMSVYAFDLSDYADVIRNDAGATVGNTISLLDLGNDLFLGVRSRNSTTCCVTVYRKDGYLLEVVDEYSFTGSLYDISRTLKLDTQNKLIGFQTYIKSSSYSSDLKYYYVLLGFEGGELVELEKIALSREQYGDNAIKTVYLDGYLYLFSPTGNIIRKIEK